MDLNALIPISAIVVGIPSFIAFVALLVSHTRKMKDLALRERELELGSGAAPLIHELDYMRAQIAELQQRLDRAERQLTPGTPKQD